MYSRDRLIDLFSTFVRLEDDRFRQWIVDPRLQRSMRLTLQHPPLDPLRREIAADAKLVWAIYWHQQWMIHPLAQLHLTAYLQEPCFWAAQELARRYPSPQYTLADYFQIANGDIPRVLKSFTLDRGGNLKTYAQLILTNALKDLLRQRQAADVCSDWALLRKVSKKRIREVLLHRGVLEPQASQYQFAWFCFKTIYIPAESNGRQLRPPDPQVWREIVELYHTKRQDLLVVPGATLTSAQIEFRLIELAKWCRAYLYPAIDSLNRPKPEAGELQDDLTDGTSGSLVDRAIQLEQIEQRITQRSQLHAILTQALVNLLPELQEILRLFYREGLSQQELASQLQLSQATICRRIKQAESALLAALLQWIESQLNKFPDPTELKAISTTLKEWLIEYFSG